MKQILIVKDASWLDWLELHAPALLDASLPCALNLETYSRLRARGGRCIGAWDYLDPEAMRAIVAEATELSHAWLAPLRGVLQFGGIDVPATARVETLDLFREGLYAARVVRALLAQETPDCIVLPPLDDRPAVAQRSHTIFEAVARFLIEPTTTRIRWLPALPEPTTTPPAAMRIKAALRRHAPAPMLAAMRAARRAMHQQPARAPRLLTLADLPGRAEQPAERPTAIVVGMYHDFIMLADLAQQLERHNACRVLRIHLPPGTYDFYQIVRSQPGYRDLMHTAPMLANGLEYLPLEGLPEYAAALARHTPLCDPGTLDDLRAASASRCPELFANPYLEPQFHHFNQVLWPGVAAAAETMQQVIAALRPDLVIGANGSSGDRACLLAAQAHGIATLLLVAGYVGDLEGLAHPTDQIAAQGQNLHRRLSALGKPDDRLPVTGHLKLDHSVHFQAVALGQAAALRSRLGLSEGRRTVLLLTADVGYALFPAMDLSEHHATLAEICAIAQRMPETDFLFKPHPRFDQIATYRRLIHQHGVEANVHIVENVHIDQVAPLCDVVMLVNSLTTALFHVLLQHKPAIAILTAHSAFREAEDSFLATGGALVVRERRAIEDTLVRLLHDPGAYRYWVERGQLLLMDCMDQPDGRATERVVALAEQLLEDVACTQI